jgi:uncharacterized protein
MSTKRTAPPAAATSIDLSAWPCLRTSGSQVIVDVSVSPNAKKTELVGWHDGALRIRLQAQPVEGAANAALRKWLAQSLGLSTASVQLLRGDTSRRKQWRLDAPVEDIVQWLRTQPALQNDGADPDKPLS